MSTINNVRYPDWIGKHECSENLKTIYDDVRTPFAADRFNMSRLPINIGSAASIGQFSTLPSCLDMLIKMPGADLVIPDPYNTEPVTAMFIQLALEFEDRLLPEWRETHYLYLTVDQRQVEPGLTHRNEGWHFDGMQGARHHPKLTACHQYVMSSRLPTEYCDHLVDASELDENAHNWFRELGAQVPLSYVPHTSEPFSVNLMSAYQLHRSPIAGPKEGGWRTFCRLDVSRKQQDRLGNTINPDLPAPWEFVERKLPDNLQTKRLSSSWTDARKF